MTDTTEGVDPRDTAAQVEHIGNQIGVVADRVHRLEGIIDKIEIISNAEPTQDKVFAALAKAQAELTDADKDVEVDTGKYKYRYATLSSVLSVVRPILAKHDLALTQLPGRSVQDGTELLTLTTIIAHKSGQTIENYFEMYPPQRDPQGIGSAMTYMRRYVIMAMCGIAGADDDDAERTKVEKPKITAAQADKIFEQADELFGDDAESMLERMCKKIHMVDAVRDIPADEFEVALARLANQAKKRGTAPPPADEKPKA